MKFENKSQMTSLADDNIYDQRTVNATTDLTLRIIRKKTNLNSDDLYFFLGCDFMQKLIFSSDNQQTFKIRQKKNCFLIGSLDVILFISNNIL